MLTTNNLLAKKQAAKFCQTFNDENYCTFPHFSLLFLVQVRGGLSDLGVGFPSITEERAGAVHFTAMTYALDYGYLASPPLPADPSFKTVTVFQSSVWLCTLAATAAETALVLAVHFFYKRLGVAFFDRGMGLSDLFLLPTAVLTSQISKLPRQNVTAGAVIMLKWVVTALLLTSFYKSILLAHLVAEEYEPPINSSEVRNNSVFPVSLTFKTGRKKADCRKVRVLSRRSCKLCLRK